MKVGFEALACLLGAELFLYNAVFFLRKRNARFDLEKEKSQRRKFNWIIGFCCIVSLIVVGVL